MALFAIAKLFLLFVVYLFSPYDKATAIRAKNPATKSAMMLPPYEGSKLFLATVTIGDIFIIDPLFFGTDEFTYCLDISHMMDVFIIM
jgi:hypothetical protein